MRGIEDIKQMLKGGTSIGVERRDVYECPFLENVTLPVNTIPDLVKLNEKLEANEVRDKMVRNDIRGVFQRY